MILKHRKTCRICGNPHLCDVIDLGDQYLQGSFVKEGVTEPSHRKIPTKLVRCDVTKNENGCGLVQMSVTTPPKILYSNYWYQSGVSKTMREHLADIAGKTMELIHRGRPYQLLSVCDLACNDGELLSHFPREMIRCGIDPSDIARKASEKAPGSVIVNDLFPTGRPLPATRFDAITTIAMFYDIENPVSFLEAVKERLEHNGIWVVEVAYLPATLRQVSFDTVVHEHLMYYSLSTLESVIAAAGLRVFRAETNDINGGSIQVYCSKAECSIHDRQEWTDALNRIRMEEFDLKLDTEEPYELFRSKCQIVRHELVKLIRSLRAAGKTIHQYGSSTKSNTLLQYCGLNHTDIPYAAERAENKWGARTLGTDIEIISEEASRKMAPDYYLVGPWHFKNEILQREKDTINGDPSAGRKGIKFIFPLPAIEIVEKVP